MKAWQVYEWGEPEAMTLNGDAALPEPLAGQVRIKTRAAAINFFDMLIVQGKYQTKPPFPFTPGSEVAGTVDAVGAGVENLQIGDRVLAMNDFGGFAEFTLAAANKTFRIPNVMDFAEAAAMPVIYQTSYFALKTRGLLQAGEWLLVHAAAGGVGSSAVQLGKFFGARVIATAGSREKLDFCLRNGAEHALNYADENWVEQVKEITGGRGADVIYDPVGGDVFDASTKCIAAEGRLLVIGFAGGKIPSVAANRVLLKNIAVVGCFWGGYLQKYPNYAAETQAELFRLYEAGKIKPVVSRTFDFSEVPAAIRAVAERKTVGKVVVAI